MQKYLLLLLIIFIPSSIILAQKKDKKLEALIHAELSSFKGEVGIYIHHLKKNKVVAINENTLFPTASLVKISILVGVFNKIAQEELTLDQKFIYDAKRVYGGSGLMQFYKDSAQTDLSTMIALMLTYSDNVTSIWLQELAGGGQLINEQMDKLDLPNTKVNSFTEGRETIREEYGWGHTTPKELAKLFELIRNGEVISPAHSDRMYRYLKNQFYDERILSQIPPTVNTIAKTGSVNAARGEIVLINAPNGDYIISFLTKNNEDQSWTHENSAEELSRRISAIVWNYYEPKHPFRAYPRIK